MKRPVHVISVCLQFTVCYLLLIKVAHAQGVILQPGFFKHYIDSFNAEDQELYPQYIPNNKSWDFLSKNIPLFDCPDKQLEQTYYFRWWTYRKHIRKTPEGFVVLEFLPEVDWAGKYNTINCAAALHVYEGRWLHDSRYIEDYERFWYNGGGDMGAYSCWMADAIENEAFVTGDRSLAIALEKQLIHHYLDCEKKQMDSNGLYWQIDGKDGMEMSICGGDQGDQPDYRATINSYQYGDALAIAAIAGWTGEIDITALYRQKASLIKSKMQSMLWDDSANFFKVLKRDLIDSCRNSNCQLCTARELHGYTPWFFNLPSSKHSVAWRFLMNPHYFFAPFGPTTAEQNHPGFHISYQGHECQWNGPSWPMATSITLTALANLLNNYSQNYITNADYFRLLLNYSREQKRQLANGKIVPWIDENLNPYTGDWLSRTRLSTWENGHWSAEKGGVERGKDYNHSTFCDLIITGLIGIRPADGKTLVVNPLVPKNTWGYFCLDNILYHGQILTILYDRGGKHYHRGSGLQVFVNGRLVASAPKLTRINIKI